MNSSLTRKLEAAVTLLTGHGALKDRLGLAYSECLETLDEHDLAEEAQDEFAQMTQAMHRARALPGDNIVRASIRKLSNEDAQAFAMLIVRIYGLHMADLGTTRVPVRSAPARGATPLAALLALDSPVMSASSLVKVARRSQRL
jgi:hypothetical protein